MYANDKSMIAIAVFTKAQNTANWKSICVCIFKKGKEIGNSPISITNYCFDVNGRVTLKTDV